MRLTSSNDKSDTRRVSLLSLLIQIGGWLGLAAGIAGVALHYSGTRSLLLIVGASLTPFLVVAAFLGACGFAVVRKWRMAAITIGVTVGAAATQIPLYLQSNVGSGERVTVMQANVLFDGASARTIIDLVREHDVDILTVNELTAKTATALEAEGLGDLLRYSFVRPENFADGTGIYSRFPLSAEVVQPGFIMNNLSATAHIPDLGDVAVFALHPVPPPYDPNDWNAEMGRVHDLLARTTGPAIVGADFNATYDHRQFRALLGKFEDATDQAGAGHLLTYPTDKWGGFPIIGVDHILVANGTATEVQTLDLPGSDHRALLATVVIDR